MVKCPKCQATLPDGAYVCQFCQTSFGTAPRVPGRPAIGAAGKSSIAAPGAPGWVVPFYYLIAAWWVVDGAQLAYQSLSGGLVATLGLVIGVVSALVGLGLLLRIEAARGIVNVLCFLQILDGLLALVFLLFSGIGGLWGAVSLIFTFIRIGFAGLMIYLIGETDSRAPNF